MHRLIRLAVLTVFCCFGFVSTASAQSTPKAPGSIYRSLTFKPAKPATQRPVPRAKSPAALLQNVRMDPVLKAATLALLTVRDAQKASSAMDQAVRRLERKIGAGNLNAVAEVRAVGAAIAVANKARGAAMRAVQRVVQRQVDARTAHPAVTVLVQKYRASEHTFASASARFVSVKRAFQARASR